MCDLIFVSLEDWDEVWRRNQFICATLAKRFPSMKILFVMPARRRVPLSRAGRCPVVNKPVEGLPNVLVTAPAKLLPESWMVGRAVNRWAFAHHVRRSAKRAALHRPLLWLNAQSAVHLAGRCGERATIYDITDDWSLASFPQPELDRIRRQDAELCRRADLVIVCSEALLASRNAMSRRILLLPNGVDAAHYAHVGDPASESTAGEERPGQGAPPVFGYTGTLHPDRIDVPLVVALARAFPHGTVVLIGPNHLDPPSQAALSAQPNVKLRGPVPYASIPLEMSEFSVCIVPHRETAFTESLNPIKLWEYLAAGKPIVSTNVAGFRQFSGLCRIASGPGAFVEACTLALAEGDVHQAARRAAVADHTWEARTSRLLKELADAGIVNHNEIGA